MQQKSRNSAVSGGGSTTKPRKQPSARAVLEKQVRQHNETSRDRGPRILRRLLTSVVRLPEFTDAVRPLEFALRTNDWLTAVKLARGMLEQEYTSAGEHFIASQAAHLVRKYPFPASKEAAVSNGMKKFLHGERHNRHVNRVLLKRRREGLDLQSQTMHHVRNYMQRLLGDKVDLTEIATNAGWGPGANVGVTGRYTNFARKFLASKWTCTVEALPLFLTCAKERPEFWDILGLTRTLNLAAPGENPSGYQVRCVDPAEFIRRALQRIEIVDYNKIALVPKDADCHRTIASEPLCNSWLQKGIEECIKLRLRRFGIDLRTQELNQRWAREGSVEGVVNPRVTIDLTNASGSICTEIVRDALLYVPVWFDVLADTRSPGWRLPGSDTTVNYHGFASMGNGFCFPLETALFAAACYAAHKYTGTEQDFTCYGDDIVVRQNEACVLIEILRSMGFSVNRSKTFCFGPFRESCGTDWYLGTDVRPIVLDTSLEKLEERIRFHNALARLPNEYASKLSEVALELMPPFWKKLVRPFADHTDEAIDGRHLHWPLLEPAGQHGQRTWYGLSFNPVKDEEIEDHADYHTALYYGCLAGCKSQTPFAERRETSMRVRRFSHSGNTSNWLPLPAPLMGVYPDSYGYSLTPIDSVANLVVRRMGLRA